MLITILSMPSSMMLILLEGTQGILTFSLSCQISKKVEFIRKMNSKLSNKTPSWLPRYICTYSISDRLSRDTLSRVFTKRLGLKIFTLFSFKFEWDAAGIRADFVQVNWIPLVFTIFSHRKLATMQFPVRCYRRSGIAVLNDTEVIIATRNEAATRGHSVVINTVSKIIIMLKNYINKVNGETNDFICKKSFIWSAAKL